MTVRGRIELGRAARVAVALLAVSVACAIALGAHTDRANSEAPAPLLSVGVDVLRASPTDAAYRLVVENNGDGPASGVTLANPIPANTTFASASPAQSGGACCSWTLGDLAAGASATVDLTLALAQPASGNYLVTDVATASDAGGHQVSDTDDSLNRAFPVPGSGTHTAADTYVDNAPGVAAGTDFGSCPVLKVRRDGTATAFFQPHPEVFSNPGGLQNMERIWGAQLRAYPGAATAGPATRLGLHRVETQWLAGTTCGGTGGSGIQPRTGWKPASSATPTAVATYPGNPAGAAEPPITWDVTDDMDTPEDREAVEGWEIVDEDSGTGDGQILSVLKSTQAADQKLSMAFVYTTKEEPTCIDVDRDVLTSTSQDEAALTALVTDGARVSTGSADGCSGGPVAGGRVYWNVQDDDPDVYISSRDGAPTTQFGNEALTTASSAGETTIGLRMMNPNGAASGDAGTSAIAARIEGADPAATPAAQDDATQTWTWAPPPAQPESTPPAADQPPAGDTGTGPETGTRTDDPHPAPAARAITASARRTIAWGTAARVTGELSSARAACVAGQKVQLLTQRNAGDPWAPLARRTTSEGGAFSFQPVVTGRARYLVAVPADVDCAPAMSAPREVVPRAVVTLASNRLAVPRHGRLVLSGSVRPGRRGGPVVLQRKAADGWVRVRRARLGAASRYRFRLTAAWRGDRIFRVRWVGRPFGPSASNRLALLSR